MTSYINDRGKRPISSPVSLTADVSGVLPTANGGTSVDIASAALPLGSGQITFPATQNPSANANTLDDYEEGTWTPVDSSGAGLSLTVTNATYTKIGRSVFIQDDITYPATANGAVTTVGGLPFTSGTGTTIGGMASYYNTTAAVCTWQINGGGTVKFGMTVGGVQITNANMATHQTRSFGAYST